MDCTTIEKLKAGMTVNLGPYITAAEMKRELARYQEAVPTAWVRRSPSTNNWIVSPA